MQFFEWCANLRYWTLGFDKRLGTSLRVGRPSDSEEKLWTTHLSLWCNRDRTIIWKCNNNPRRSQWPRGLRRRSSAARLLRLWVRIPPEAWIFVCCEFFVLSGRGLCDGLVTCPEQSYRLWRVVVCDQEISKTRRLKLATRLWKYNQNGRNAKKTNKQ